ncbi:hypothetical protein QRX50_02050 [Amycolatopsis carbonis]|uniref:Uncharacterized protein n=1 Tax=Amycolatopsis carbonis TaxID=715471 RepID=A0A9Y2III4_9PSEU|nr:hypothetical protein [Amycolatopsis sp. 2-15]WIX79611.1 hypothetical protein QRX50_02050 [Amycolatopsis sp. 2-15]
MASPDTEELTTAPLAVADVAACVARGAEVPDAAHAASTEADEHGEPPEPVSEASVEPPAVDAEPDPTTATHAAAYVPVAVPQRIEAVRAGKPRGRWWRGFTGSIAAGLAVLAVGVLGVGAVCLATGAPGPSVLLLVGHPVAAVAALVLQRVADRRYGRAAGLAGFGVLVVAFVALTVFWWA